MYAGLRPLLAGESDTTSLLTREHAVASPVAGLTVIAGGKYTTYRVMAKDAVDEAGRNLDSSVPESVTENIPLLGADGYPALWNARYRLAEEFGLHVARIEHLLQRYGTLIEEVLSLVREDPELGKPIEGAEDYLTVEAYYAASHEGALHLDDTITRRTHISFEIWDRGVGAARQIAELMGRTLGWDENKISEEVDHYVQRVEAERESQDQPDDESADRVRRAIRDPRLQRARTAEGEIPVDITDSAVSRESAAREAVAEEAAASEAAGAGNAGAGNAAAEEPAAEKSSEFA